MKPRGGSSKPEQGTFQFQDGGFNPTSPLHFFIAPIHHAGAREFVERWHYSHRIPTGKNICFGLWSASELYAVIVYGIGVNPYQAKFLGVESVIEIKRMCRSEPKQAYELSRLIRLSLKMAKNLMGFDAVVAFADPEQGHEGTVYKAAGFTHEGRTNAEWHLVGSDGVRRHRRYAYRMARRKGITVQEARDSLCVQRVKTEPKHRWVLRLDPLIAENKKDSENERET
ncbi:MAG TPA: hypothetical protein DCE43_11815 [Planctomycetaceae bacterium]|nr:hypothetical protein [Planctomycetaceae bacterium]